MSLCIFSLFILEIVEISLHPSVHREYLAQLVSPMSKLPKRVKALWQVK